MKFFLQSYRITFIIKCAKLLFANSIYERRFTMTESDNRKFAIYCRKSKFTGKGDSIETQIEKCKGYIALNFDITDDSEFIIYIDEGFSGKNTKRPDYQKMMKACHNHEIKAIVCYKLDRISRNTIDFSLLLEELKELKIDFISATQPFNTTDPTGEAMIKITSVFADLERKLLAERVRDNMLSLAKTGRWLGGTTPLGYRSIEVKTPVDIDGKIRTAYRLNTREEEVPIVHLIFNKFIEFNSLTKTETFLLNNHIKTRNDKNFSRFGLKAILSNPVYAAADEETLKYFTDLGTIIYNDSSEFDGKHGLMVYNKTDQSTSKSHTLHEYSEWVVSIGKHKPMITGKEWIKVQKLLELNKPKNYHKPKNNTSLLSGILVCGHCGSYMRPKANRRLDENGNKTYSYLCETKEKSRRHLCNITNPQGNLLDERVCDEVKRLAEYEDKEKFHEQIKAAKKQLMTSGKSNVTELDILQKSHKDTEKKINNLVQTLSKTTYGSASNYIQDEIETLHKEKLQIEEKIHTLNELLQHQNDMLVTFDMMIKKLSSFSESFDMMSVEEKRNVLRVLVDKVVWDGTNAELYLSVSNDEKTKPQRAGCK
ncbi:recombinase family protein [[Ruminococcus] torques]|uniref:recombinase family protein n=1 Tax=[Ruminococcus] torques TaxID=33039 RepID=UPI0039F473CD